ncbi:MAG TPA: BamA/TamA family outer membrane protein, partial [Planctomycetota bacterium]|nr:BamA/TamA family outer membrane protein [Planctomycetota bacterium]
AAALAAALLLAGPAGHPRGQEAPAQAGPTIRAVELAGEVGVAHDLLRANLRTRAGQPFDPLKLDEDVRWLADAHGILAEVAVDPGPVVRFLLSRIRRYDSVGLEGNEHFDDEELLEIAHLSADRDATPDQLRAGRERIRDRYLEDGFAFVQVEVRSRTDENGRFVAHLRVYEGPRVSTEGVTIDGLTALDPDDALGVMRSPPGFWSWLVSKDFVRAEVDSDVLLLENFVRGEGYLDARVALQRLDWSEDRSEVEVTMLVDQGPRYAVRSVRFEGVTALPEEDLRAASKVPEGSPWRRPDVARTIRAFRDLYGKRGYVDAEIEPRELFDETGPELDVVWAVNEGRQKSVRDVIVRGNTGTREDVIRRYLTFEPGQIVDTSELDWSEDLLVSLDYFTDFSGRPQVRIDTEPTPDPGMVDVVVDVNDEQSGQINFLVGAGSDQGLFAGATIDKRNFDITRVPSSFGRALTEFFGTGEAFHGGGQRLMFNVVPGTETTSIDVTFRDPWLDSSDRKPWGLTTSLYDRTRDFSEYDQGTLGFALSFDHQLSRETSVSIGGRVEEVSIDGADPASVPTIAASEGDTSSNALELGYGYKRFDSHAEPTDGFAAAVRLENAGNGLGGDTDLLRQTVTGEWFVPVHEDDQGRVSALHPRIAVGRVEPTGDTEVLPFFENFFVGGATGPFALRGFDYQGVGPHESGDATGGELALVVSVEALIPLMSEYNPFRDEDETLLKAVLFVDAGNLVVNGDFDELPTDVRMGSGAGLRLRLPALGGVTLALDYAMFVKDFDEDETRALSFELSRRF